MRNSAGEGVKVQITVFLGAPGSGKGTQAKRLTQIGKFTHLSTGDMLRAAMQAGTELGKQAKGFVDKGNLVPDSLMIGLIEETLSKLPDSSKIILDGFPRTVAQAEALDSNPKTPVSQSIYFKIPSQILVGRLTGRRVCKQCGQSFHVVFMPPRKEGVCDSCGGTLYQRVDDGADVVQKRLDVYQTQTSPLLNYYQDRKKLNELNADREAEAIESDLLKMLN